MTKQFKKRAISLGLIGIILLSSLLSLTGCDDDISKYNNKTTSSTSYSKSFRVNDVYEYDSYITGTTNSLEDYEIEVYKVELLYEDLISKDKSSNGYYSIYIPYKLPSGTCLKVVKKATDKTEGEVKTIYVKSRSSTYNSNTNTTINKPKSSSITKDKSNSTIKPKTTSKTPSLTKPKTNSSTTSKVNLKKPSSTSTIKPKTTIRKTK